MFLYLIRFVVNSCHFHGRYEGVHRVLVCITAVDVAQIALNPVFGHAYRAERIVLPDGGIYFELLSGTGYVLHMLLACVYLAVIFIALAVKIFRTPMLYAEKYLIIFGAILLNNDLAVCQYFQSLADGHVHDWICRLRSYHLLFFPVL